MMDEVSPLLDAARDRRYLLGIAGPPGSGKSTLAQSLARRANEESACLLAVALSLDGFHLTNAELDRCGLRPRKGSPRTFDVAGLVELLARLREGDQPVTAPIYSRELHEPEPDALHIEPSVRLVIVEGNYLLLEEPPWPGVRSLLDECWYLDVPEESCMERVRDRHIRGGCTPELAAQKVEANDRPNYQTVASTRSRADRVLSYEPRV